MNNLTISKQIGAEHVALEEAPFKSELIMEAYIEENPGILSDTEVKIVDSQLMIVHPWSGYKKNKGRIDLLALLDNQIPAVIELKKTVIDVSAIKQLDEYLNEIKAISQAKFNSFFTTSDFVRDDEDIQINRTDLIGIAVGAEIEANIIEQMRKKTWTNPKVISGCEISGISLKRYSVTNDLTDHLYYFAENYSPVGSTVSRVRFNDLKAAIEDSYKPVCKASSTVINNLIWIHEHIIKNFPCKVVYTPRNVIFHKINRSNNNRSQFVFMQIKKVKLRVFLYYDILKKVPSGKYYKILSSPKKQTDYTKMHPSKQRYPDQFLTIIQKAINRNKTAQSDINKFIKDSFILT